MSRIGGGRRSLKQTAEETKKKKSLPDFVNKVVEGSGKPKTQQRTRGRMILGRTKTKFNNSKFMEKFSKIIKAEPKKFIKAKAIPKENALGLKKK